MFDKTTFFDPAIDPALYQRELRRPPAPRIFVIFFTARSGSSWLTDIARASGRLSFPDECFNPGFLPVMSRALHARDLTEYLEVLRRRRNTHGVYGCQLTYHHLRAVFDTEDAFMALFSGATFVWLTREDIVLQAVSLMKMQQTKIAHLDRTDAAQIAAADAAFAYDPDEIRHWIEHNLAAERSTEALIARYGLAPLRLSYETITAAGAVRTVNMIAHHIGIPPITVADIASGHGKIGTGRNAEFADRFRHEEPDYVARLEAIRAPWLARLDRDPPTGP